MTEDGRFLIGLGATAVLNAVFIGAAWGSLSSGQKRLRDDMDNVKSALGLTNGRPGRFVTREEFVLVREQTEHQTQESQRRFEALETKDG